MPSQPIFIIVNNIYNKVFPGLAKIYDVLRTALANLQSGKPIDFSVLSSLQTEYPALAAVRYPSFRNYTANTSHLPGRRPGHPLPEIYLRARELQPYTTAEFTQRNPR